MEHLKALEDIVSSLKPSQTTRTSPLGQICIHDIRQRTLTAISGLVSSVEKLSNTSSEYISLIKKRHDLKKFTTHLSPTVLEMASQLLSVYYKPDLLCCYIHHLTEKLKLQMYTSPPTDSSPALITICGTIVVIDIGIGLTEIDSVKLTIATETSQQNDDVDTLLTNMLKSRNLVSFKNVLQQLSLLDEHSAFGAVDLFQTMTCFENDLKRIYQQELFITQDNTKRVLLEGHGLLGFHKSHFGASLTYWTNTQTIQRISSVESLASIPQDSLYKVHLQIERGPTTSYLPKSKSQYLVDNTTMITEAEEKFYSVTSIPSSFSQSLTFLVPSTDSSITAPVSFVFVLDPPVTVSLAIAREVKAIIDAPIGDSGSAASPAAKTSRSTSRSSTLANNLITDITPQMENDIVISEKESFHFSYGASSTSPILDPYVLQRIPISHPSQVFPILQILRRCLTFRELCHSGFKARPQVPDDSDQDVEMMIIERPIRTVTYLTLIEMVPFEVLVFQFVHQRPPYHYQLRISLKTNNNSGSQSGPSRSKLTKSTLSPTKPSAVLSQSPTKVTSPVSPITPRSPSSPMIGNMDFRLKMTLFQAGTKKPWERISGYAKPGKKMEFTEAQDFISHLDLPSAFRVILDVLNKL